MPILSTIATIATIVGGATAAGTGIYSATQAGGPGSPPPPPPAPAAPNVQAEIAKRGQEAFLVHNQQAGIQANTSGGLSDQGYQAADSAAAGMPGQFGPGGFDLNSILQML